MEVKTLYLVRGLPGSGKSTLARRLAGELVFEADQYFLDDEGRYTFDASKIREAHEACQSRVRRWLKHPTSPILGPDGVVANTFTQRWELDPYIEMAAKHSARLVIVSLFDGGCSDQMLADRNIHQVPVETIAKMRARWEHDLGAF